MPDGVKTDAPREMELYLPEMLRQVDSSLLEEWERMRDADFVPPGSAGMDLPPARPDEPADDRTRWRVQQMLLDAEGLNDWVAEWDMDLAASREQGEPVLELVRLRSLV